MLVARQNPTRFSKMSGPERGPSKGLKAKERNPNLRSRASFNSCGMQAPSHLHPACGEHGAGELKLGSFCFSSSADRPCAVRDYMLQLLQTNFYSSPCTAPTPELSPPSLRPRARAPCISRSLALTSYHCSNSCPPRPAQTSSQ